MVTQPSPLNAFLMLFENLLNACIKAHPVSLSSGPFSKRCENGRLVNDVKTFSKRFEKLQFSTLF
jgi:hypothetical protein